MSDLDYIDIIASSRWFEGLPDVAINKLAAAAETKELPVNSFIYAQGKPTTEVCCILSGRARVSISSPNGHEFALVDREEGTWFGEPGLVNDEGRVVEARIIEPSRILVIPRRVVQEVGDEHPLMFRNLFYYNQELLRALHELLAGILFYPLRSRVAGRLLHLASEHGEQVNGGILMDIKVSQNDFARLALGSRQRVNKVFRDWSARGLVEMRDDHLLIRDIELLKQEIDLFDS